MRSQHRDAILGTASRAVKTGHVRLLSPRDTAGVLSFGGLAFACAIGRSGQSARKREGDGATPRGHWKIERVFYRPDRVPPPQAIAPVQPLQPQFGWCDDVADRNYNRLVQHPYPASAEHMWRDDELYDIVCELSHNRRPRVRGHGSAVFLHVARPNYTPTEGCIALRTDHLQRLLAAGMQQIST